MKRAIRLVLLSFVVVAVSGAGLSRAAPPDVDALMADAKERFDAGAFGEAISLWEQAYAIDPQPVVVLSIAVARQKAGEKVGAWRDYRRFLASSDDTAKKTQVRKFVHKLEEELGDTHAPVSFSVTPAMAVIEATRRGRQVQIDGSLNTWLEAGSWTLKIKASGYREKTLTVALAAGVEHRETIRLVVAEESGMLTVRCSEPGALVYLDGVLLGPAPVLKHQAAPGSHAVVCEKPGFRRRELAAVVERDETNQVMCRLKPGAVKRRSLDWLYWILLGAGVAAGGGGGFMHYRGVDLAKQANANRSSPNYDAKWKDAENSMIGAYALYGIGGAMVLTGAALLIHDSMTGGSKGKRAWWFGPTEEGTGMVLGATF